MLLLKNTPVLCTVTSKLTSCADGCGRCQGISLALHAVLHLVCVEGPCNPLFGSPPTSWCSLPAELASVDVTQMERLWHKGPDFEKAGAAIPLIFRLATVEDKRPARGTHTSRRLWQNPAAVQVGTSDWVVRCCKETPYELISYRSFVPLAL